MERDYASEYGHVYRNHWWWRARESLVLDALGELDLPEPAEILDVGCGDGLLFPRLEQFGSVRGIEVDTELLDPDGPYRERIHTAPLGDLEYREWRFDLITALDVIEHIQDDAAAVEQIARMLRPGGYFVLTVPAFASLWSEHDVANQHHRRYRSAGLRALLEPALEVVDLRYLFHSLYLPKRLLAMTERILRRSGEPRGIAQHVVPPPLINRALTSYCRREARWLRPLRIPFGSSLLAVARRSPVSPVADPVAPSTLAR